MIGHKSPKEREDKGRVVGLNLKRGKEGHR